MFGRAVELARITELLLHDVPVVLVGEAGVGKTTLARAAIRAADRQHIEGGGFGMLSWAPYLALERALGRSLAGADTTYAVDSVVRAVGAGVLFVDDLQWVDADSRAVIDEIAGRVSLLTCVRRGDPAAAVALDGLADTFVRLDIDPIDDESAAELARHVRPIVTLPAARRIARLAGGNPLLVTELAIGGDDAPTLAAAIRSRLAPLGDAARDSMALLAVAGRPMPPAALGDGAGELASSGLAVVDAGGLLRMRHDLIASTASDALSDDQRRAVHRRLARRSSDPGEQARHHAAAGERRMAGRRAIEAAEGASTLGERVAHLELAAACADGAEADQLRVEAARALVEALEPVRALELLGPLRGSSRPDVALVEAQALRQDYEVEAAQQAIERGQAALADDAATPPDVVVRLAIEEARLAAAALRDAVDAVALGQRAVDVAESHGIHLPAALAALGATRMVGGDMGGTADLAAGMDAAFEAGDRALGLAIGSQLAFAYLRGGRHDDGKALVTRLAADAHHARLGVWELQMAFWASGFAWHGGDFVAATTTWAAFDVDPSGQPELGWYEIQALADVGRLDEARIRADRALDCAKPGEYDLGEALWLAADVACFSGRWADTIRFADRHEQSTPSAHQRVFVELPSAWATYELGRPPAWPRYSGQVPIMRGGPIELEAIRALAEGQPTTAIGLFDEAADAWAGCHARGELRSHWAAGESLRLAGRAADATTRLLAVEGRLVAASHLPLLARTRRSLRQLGVRRSVSRVVAPGSFLTARERQVLELSGLGLRDMEIATRLGVSRWAIVRAAESAAAKLGATTRAEAVSRIGTS